MHIILLVHSKVRRTEKGLTRLHLRQEVDEDAVVTSGRDLEEQQALRAPLLYPCHCLTSWLLQDCVKRLQTVAL